MKTRFFLVTLFIAFVTMSFECTNDPVEVDDARDNIVGKWACALDDGSGVPYDYEIEISKDNSNDNQVFLSNFAFNGETATATLTGKNLTVAQQNVGSSSVFADGTISDNYQEITWTINIDGDDYTMSSIPGGITKSYSAK